MSFLTPLFLLGALAVAGPIVFHLIRRSPKQRVRFSSLMFLSPSPPRVSKRKRLEHILLLIMRGVIICLLALAFARPFFNRPLADEARANPRLIRILLLDRSASMRQDNLWQEAMTTTQEAIRAADPSDSLALLTFDRGVHTVMDIQEWRETDPSQRQQAMIQKLEAVKPGWAATELDNALIVASELFEESRMRVDERQTAVRGEITVISDFQEGATLERLQGYEWPDKLEFKFQNVRRASSGNAGVQFLADTHTLGEDVGEQRVRVVNSAESPTDRFEITWAGANGVSVSTNRMTVYVPAGQSRVIQIPDPAAAEVELKGDGNPFDNRSWRIAGEKKVIPIIYLGNEEASDPAQPLYYLRQAFEVTPRYQVNLLPHPTLTEVAPETLESASVIIATDLPSRADAEKARSILASGKTMLLALKTNFSADNLASLLGVDSIKMEEAFVRDYALLGRIEFTHPLFIPFADPRFSDFTKIHFWKYRALSLDPVEDARVLASFDNADPALVEIPIGQGKLLLLTSGWHPEDSQLALSSKFVPLLYSLMEFSGAISEHSTSFLVGDPVPVNAKDSNGPVQIRKPDGAVVEAGSDTSFSATDQPGIYVLEGMEAAPSFVINLDPRESQTGRMDLDRFTDMGVPVGESTRPNDEKDAVRKARLLSAELEQRQKLWRWILLVTALLLVVESWLAGKLVRARATPTEQPA